MLNIEARHWVFIVGFICSAVMSKWSPSAAESLIFLLLLMGVGMVIFR